jgi:hypothetical protein
MSVELLSVYHVWNLRLIDHALFPSKVKSCKKRLQDRDGRSRLAQEKYNVCRNNVLINQTCPVETIEWKGKCMAKPQTILQGRLLDFAFPTPLDVAMDLVLSGFFRRSCMETAGFA